MERFRRRPIIAKLAMREVCLGSEVLCHFWGLLQLPGLESLCFRSPRFWFWVEVIGTPKGKNFEVGRRDSTGLPVRIIWYSERKCVF